MNAKISFFSLLSVFFSYNHSMLDILQKYSIRAKKHLGQNFLLDENILQKIADIIPLEWKNIIEVGPGFWALTQYICAKNPQSLTCVEFDSDMVHILQKRIQNQELFLENRNIEIVQKDILKYIPVHETYSVIANIPYYITSPILQHFLYSDFPVPKNMVILMQKEVCERITSEKSSVLSLLVQKKWTVSANIFVPKQAFSPAPKVDSQILHISTYTKYDFLDDSFFLRLIKHAFSHPRKKLLSNLVHAGHDRNQLLEILEKLWGNENSRAEDFTTEQYVEMCTMLQRN